MPSRTRRRRLAVTSALVLIAPLLVVGPAAADPNNNSPAKLTKAVTLDGVMRHLDAFQDIADVHGDRAAGRPGYRASVDYVVDTLTSSGYAPTVQEFEFPYSEEKSELQQLTPTAKTYVVDRDFTRNGFTPTFIGEVTSTVVPVDVVIPPGPDPNSNTSGCEASDFVTFPAGNIALLQRGSCGFAQKTLNAQAAGAVGVILFNEGQPGRTGLSTPIGDTPGLAIPVVFATFAVGAELASDGPRVVRVKVDFLSDTRTAWNVFAESRAGLTGNTVMAGAHLDSVQDGAGINDNGTGSAALLEVAVKMAKVKSNNLVRFAWWGAEEEGLLGSEHYIATLPQAEQDRIALYLNFDMVGSPNYFNGVYDGDNSSGTAPPGFIPPGSAEIEDVFEKFYADRGVPSEDTEFSGRSDYGPFIAVGIPAGGLFTGAEGVKTAAQAALYGGVAGAAYDPCYHQPCDSFTPVADGADAALYAQLAAGYDLRGNVNAEALDVNADAIATAVITFAFDTSTVNGVRSPGKSHGAGTSSVRITS
ncbi:aminopeptidase Y [Saccharothrix ecbatanensis]|uniref:Aminopeptidase Y n=1 Tax=Saccharothrix ecbatanensis TaxID=1105145 RepID=A0A7W9HLG2_9PSEU|nr:M28 family metallopeptidase [Saccharothrix ecbatanensis]MBB5804171.1 aminopeptidase Y [Saccharothrix ecbatanensis]